MLGGLLAGMPPIKRIAAGVTGAGAARILPALINRMVPMVPTVGAVGMLVKALVTLVSGSLVGKFLGKQFGEDYVFGGLIVIGDEAMRTYAYPAVGVSAYLDDTAPPMGAYLYPGMGAYLSPGQTVPSLGGPGGFYNPSDYGPGTGGSPSLTSRLDADSRF